MIVLLILVGSARFFLHLVIHASRSVGSFAVNAAMRLAIGSSWYSKKVWRSDSRVARRVIFVNNCALSDSDLSMVPLVMCPGNRLVCRWFEAGERVQYNSRWIRDASRNIHLKNISPSVLDFTRFSPFGGARWYAPDRER